MGLGLPAHQPAPLGEGRQGGRDCTVVMSVTDSEPGPPPGGVGSSPFYFYFSSDHHSPPGATPCRGASRNSLPSPSPMVGCRDRPVRPRDVGDRLPSVTVPGTGSDFPVHLGEVWLVGTMSGRLGCSYLPINWSWSNNFNLNIHLAKGNQNTSYANNIIIDTHVFTVTLPVHAPWVQI